MANRPEGQPLPRVLIVQTRSGEFAGAYCDGVDEPVEVVVAARRADGTLCGRPTPSLAMINPELVAEAFRLVDTPVIRTRVRALRDGLVGDDDDELIPE